jgi:thiol-disulfide isomerase/thioredoxin
LTRQHRRQLAKLLVVTLCWFACSCGAAERGGPLPASRGGEDVVGRSILALLPDAWIGEPPALDTGPVLVRFWTDTCPFCASSLPAIDSLRREFADRGLTTVAVYHPKPARTVDPQDVAAAAERLGYSGAVVVDHDWAALRRIWLDAGPARAATSASFLTDREGRVAWVHPGPEMHPSDDESHARCAADWADLRQAVELLLDS